MHYDFKKKLNKIDSQQKKNLLIPEIDWTLNEAQNLYVDIIAQPRFKMHPYLGFEKSQKNIDDIRTLVINDHCSNISNFGNITNSQFPKSNLITLPDDYRYFIKGTVEIEKNKCGTKDVRLYIQEHDDMFEEDSFYQSSFEWGVVNGLFTNQGLKIFSDGTFENKTFCLSYIRNPKFIHNAEDYRNGSYTLPSGEILTGTQNCELPKHTHSTIVDIAVMLATGEIQAPDYQIKFSKLQLNNIP